ncbi:serine hydrolase domain-containing protein [Cytobacillus sp. FJAT-54145]|uniref:Serine hydrolase domain-containing protein n=1 Tax=Cytobacillus spartinae TaxID=3299023 RepID=A0ABW6K6Y9_9BACI
MRREEAKTKIDDRLKRIVDSDSRVYNAYLLIHSEKQNLYWNFAHGQTGEKPAIPEQSYHTASIAKAFTAVIIVVLEEKGLLDYHDPIAKYLPEQMMNGLHFYKGKDYSQNILIEHLVSCTSGLPDFYEDKPKQGKHFLDLLLDESTRVWTPQETIEWTKQQMSPKFLPGEKCHYSNTGYNLLGLIIETITSKPYHEVLHEYIFKPLKMNQTYLSQYSKPAEETSYPIANVNMKSREIVVEEHQSFSSIYAGGQAVSTSEDLLKFMKALVEGRLITKESLTRMKTWSKLWMGIEYGYGLMRVRMLPFTDKYNAWGHLGSIGSFMLYNPVMDTYIIGSFNASGYVAKSIQFVFKALRVIAKIK